MEKIIAELGWIALSFLLGSLPIGMFLAKQCHDINLREVGSRNTGATNVARTCSLKLGILTFVLDVGKGFLPVVIAQAMSHSTCFLTWVGLAAILGHMYSVFLDGKGGKGVATTIGVFLALTPCPLLLAVLLCLIMIWATGYISLGSLCLATSLPLFILLSGNLSFLLLSLIVMLFIYAKHRENIARLVSGNENSWLPEK